MRIETYKGIEFVRISAMTEEQQALIHKTLDKSKIIKILCEHELLNDCVQVSAYKEWSAQFKRSEHEAPVKSEPVSELTLAFK